VGEIMKETIEVLPLYHADLFVVKDVGTEEQREDLKKQILHAKENNIGEKSGSNPGCWRSNITYDNMDWLYDAVRGLSDQANKMYFELDHIYKSYVEKCKNRDINIWTNVNEVGSKNVLHTHNADAWAGIYYVQGEGTGNLMFHNPANVLTLCNHISPFTKKMGIQPKDGMLVIWPGWVPHEVEENISDKQRINIAWGVNYK
tara:strand:- start:59 stop:664 length:606 start_codon:yes stop_codon:yes gene_type:complete